jgi:hypothetical protein
MSGRPPPSPLEKPYLGPQFEFTAQASSYPSQYQSNLLNRKAQCAHAKILAEKPGDPRILSGPPFLLYCGDTRSVRLNVVHMTFLVPLSLYIAPL